MTKQSTRRTPRGADQATLTEAEYRALIQKFVDRARADQSIAERLAEEARLRFGAATDAPPKIE